MVDLRAKRETDFPNDLGPHVQGGIGILPFGERKRWPGIRLCHANSLLLGARHAQNRFEVCRTETDCFPPKQQPRRSLYHSRWLCRSAWDLSRLHAVTRLMNAQSETSSLPIPRTN